MDSPCFFCRKYDCLTSFPRCPAYQAYMKVLLTTIRRRAQDWDARPSKVAKRFSEHMATKARVSAQESEMCNTVADVADYLSTVLEKEQQDAQQRLLYAAEQEAQEQAQEKREEQAAQGDESDDEEIIVARVVKRNPHRECKMGGSYFDCLGKPQRNNKMPHFKPY